MNTVRLRLISTSLAAALTVSVAYLALTQKFAVIKDFFADLAPIVMVEDKLDPVRPVIKTPPPREQKIQQRVTPEVSEAAPIPTVFPDDEPAVPQPAVITNPTWIERPSGRDFARYYPERALQRDRAGRVVLDCVVDANGRIGCTILSEEPAGWGFGDAALRISQSFRMSPRLENGAPTEGGHVQVPITFRLD